MNMYYIVEPEVAGGLGRSVVMDRSIHPPLVKELEYRFEGWEGDELVESFPVFIVAEALADLLVSQGLTGFSLDEAFITRDEQFSEKDFNDLPRFHWLKVNGTPEQDDFWIGEDYRLCVSSSAMQILKRRQIDYADIEEVQA